MPVAASVTLGTRVVSSSRSDEPVRLRRWRRHENRGGVEIPKNAVVGSRCKISLHMFICEDVTIEDDVFVGHGVMFNHDLQPRATANGRVKADAGRTVVPVRVQKQRVRG